MHLNLKVSSVHQSVCQTCTLLCRAPAKTGTTSEEYMQYWVHCLESASKMGDELGNAWPVHIYWSCRMLQSMQCLQQPCAARWVMKELESLLNLAEKQCCLCCRGIKVCPGV